MTRQYQGLFSPGGPGCREKTLGTRLPNRLLKVAIVKQGGMYTINYGQHIPWMSSVEGLQVGH